MYEDHCPNYEKYQCHVCKTDGNIDKKELMKSVRSNNRQYYICRKCNNEKSKKYRATKNGKINTRKAVYKSIKKNKEKQASRILLNMAINKGIIKKGKCEKCGSINTEGHHTNYLEPLNVKWLCRGCHADIHKNIDKIS